MIEHTTTTIDLLRHGECQGGNIYRGSTDVALSDQGWQSLRRATQVNELPWQHIITSPLQRCHSFAKTLAEQHQLPLHVVDDFQETHFGEWEGRRIEDVWQNDRQRVQAWVHEPLIHSPPGGELTEDFATRVRAALTAVIEQHRCQHSLIVTHGGVIRMLLAHALNIPVASFYRFDVPYACRSRIQVMHSEHNDLTRLVAHNADLNLAL